MIEVTVKADDDGVRLDRWFKRHHPEVTHAMLEKFLRKTLVKVNGKRAKASDRLDEGMVIKMPELTLAKRDPKARPAMDEKQVKKIQSLVLYKDVYAIAVNKPSGLAVQGGSGLKENLDDMLDVLKFDAKERPKLVHRLDKDTSGVLLLGRTANATSRLAEQFASKQVRKIYWALVVGVPAVEQGTINLRLVKEVRGKDSRMKGVDQDQYELVQVDEENGQSAVTHYRVVEKLGKNLSWVELLPVTGRTHQLRVHMAEIGHPIVGDGKYGGPRAFIEEGIALAPTLHLHARRLIMPMPGTKPIDVTAPLTSHMKESWKQLGFSEKDSGVSIVELMDA